MDLFSKTIEYVDKSFQWKQKPHFERTVFWLERFLPEANEAHKIAAYSHDIERSFRDEKTKNNLKNYLDKEFLRVHQEKGAEIMAKFLKSQKSSEDVIKTVRHLISKHEVGGDEEQNALMDADSVSFFETNAELFVNEKAAIEGYEEVKEKLDWMFNRISSKKRKEIARENYEKWSKILEGYRK
ncbi:MAG: DUF4202 family protein [Candidatus Paceibacterota bacterium]|nr:MAG: DUF4202 family protein [Candidatus Paceibacterota bacterium]